MTTKKKKVYPCLHCHTPWDELYLAELCFKIDMENLTKVKGEKRNAKDKASYRKK
jgi:hypothetical protein